MYLTFDEYEKLGGTLDETTFNDFEFEAESYVNHLTFSRLIGETEISANVKRCMYALIKLLENKANATMFNVDYEKNGVMSSQSNDGVSVSYRVMSATDVVRYSKSEMGNVVRRYLEGETTSDGRKLLYRGLYSGE